MLNPGWQSSFTRGQENCGVQNAGKSGIYKDITTLGVIYLFIYFLNDAKCSLTSNLKKKQTKGKTCSFPEIKFLLFLIIYAAECSTRVWDENKYH